LKAEKLRKERRLKKATTKPRLAGLSFFVTKILGFDSGSILGRYTKFLQSPPKTAEDIKARLSEIEEKLNEEEKKITEGRKTALNEQQEKKLNYITMAKEQLNAEKTRLDAEMLSKESNKNKQANSNNKAMSTKQNSQLPIAQPVVPKLPGNNLPQQKQSTLSPEEVKNRTTEMVYIKNPDGSASLVPKPVELHKTSIHHIISGNEGQLNRLKDFENLTDASKEKLYNLALQSSNTTTPEFKNKVAELMNKLVDEQKQNPESTSQAGGTTKKIIPRIKRTRKQQKKLTRK
jgi:hypothetical protein